jgi:hypothetical protein
MASIAPTTLTAVLSAVSAVLLGWIGLALDRQKDQADANARLTRATLDQLAEERQRLAGQRDVELKVHDAVVSALQDGSERRQIIARSLVNAMVIDTVLRRALLEALRQQGVPVVRAAVTQDLAFDQQTVATRATAAAADGSTVSQIDLFWCESSSGRAKEIMDSTRARLARRGLPSTQIRVRRLPASINSRPGYNVFGYQVRLESGEQRVAELVRQELAGAVGNAPDVSLIPVGSKTPGYLSAFACP